VHCTFPERKKNEKKIGKEGKNKVENKGKVRVDESE
jgi:hypothetical protein